MNKIKQKKRASHRILDLVIGFLCVCMVGAGAFAISMFHESYNFSYDSDSFYWRLEDENFAQIVEMYHTNEAAGVEPDAELEQYYGVARYFEAASYYKIYQKDGDSERMEIYAKQMEDAKHQMGALDFLSDTICEKLEIQN